MMMHCDRSTRRLSPKRKSRLVENAEQQLPERVAGLLDLVEQEDRKLQLFGVPLVQRFLGQQGVRFPVPEVARRRPDQLGDLVRMLKLRAIDLDARARVAEQRLGQSLDDPGFPRTRRSQEQEVAHRASRRVQPGQEHLVDFYNLFDGLILPDYFAA